MTKNRIFILFTFLALCSISGCSRHTTEHVKVVMKKYEFEPAVIKVKSGDTVELELSTVDVQHGFDIPQLGIHVPVPKGKSTVFSFKAPDKGEYQIKCGVICGPHHDDMQAKLVVE